MAILFGFKFSKNQRKIRNRLYRQTPHRFGVVYQSLRARREYANAEDARRETSNRPPEV